VEKEEGGKNVTSAESDEEGRIGATTTAAFPPPPTADSFRKNFSAGKYSTSQNNPANVFTECHCLRSQFTNLDATVRVRFCLTSSMTFCYTLSMTKMGRPKKPAKERSSQLIALRLTSAEHKSLEQAAEKAKLSVSDYIRTKLGLRGEL
jgi:hypothetical protein